MEYTILFRDHGKSLNLNIVPVDSFILHYTPQFWVPYLCVCVVCVWVLSRFSCVRLCGPMGCNPPGSSVHGILQARILVWVAMPSSRGSSLPKVKSTSLMSPALAGGFLTTSATWKAQCVI